VLQALVDFLADVVEEPTPPGVPDGPVDHDHGRDQQDGRDGRDDRDGLEGRGALEARER
jgi:hypothetical protein